MAFFLQWRIQPLQHRVSKLWSYSGLEDSSRVSVEDIDKKDHDKRVRALTTLTKDDKIPVLAADFFDSEHPLPTVRALFIHQLLIYLPSCILSLLCLQLFDLLLRRVTNPLFLVLLFQREDLFRLILFLLRPKPRG
jgi:hypothetical protein